VHAPHLADHLHGDHSFDPLLMNLAAVLFQVPLSIGLAASVLVARSVGASDMYESRRAGNRALLFGIAWCLISSLVVWTFRQEVVAYLTSDGQVRAVASAIFWICLVYAGFDGLQSILSFVLRGHRITFVPMLVYGCLLLVVGVGGGASLCFSAEAPAFGRGVPGFWIASSAALIATTIAFAVLSIKKRLW
jgi:MATE family multidrug resistance protein